VIQIDSLGGPVPILPGPAAPVIRIVIETEADYVELWADKCLELDVIYSFRPILHSLRSIRAVATGAV